VEGVFCAQKKLDDLQIHDLRSLVFAEIKLVPSVLTGRQ